MILISDIFQLGQYDAIKMETLTGAQLTTDRVYLKLMGVYY